jgi:cation diffusion facilitator family transporter
MGDECRDHHAHAQKHRGPVAPIRHAVRHLVAGHSHDVAGSVDEELEGRREGVRAVVVSLVLLLITAGLQVVVVTLSDSVALFSDAMHNGADALTAVPLWFAFHVAARPPTRRFTYGLGKVEDVAGLAVVSVVAVSAGLAIYSAMNRFVHPQAVTHLPVVMIAGIIGMLGNEVVAQYRIRIGRKVGSAALEADGAHARADGLASLLVVVGAVGVACGLQWADPAMGLLIALVILLVLVRTSIMIGQRLLDAVDPIIIGRITQSVLAVDGVRGVSEVRARWIGHRLHADIRLSVGGSMSVAEAHDVAERALHHLLHVVPRMSDAIVHIDPSGPNDVAHTLTSHHRHV